jgi:hypothetical protein
MELVSSGFSAPPNFRTRTTPTSRAWLHGSSLFRLPSACRWLPRSPETVAAAPSPVELGHGGGRWEGGDAWTSGAEEGEPTGTA